MHFYSDVVALACVIRKSRSFLSEIFHYKIKSKGEVGRVTKYGSSSPLVPSSKILFYLCRWNMGS